MFKISECFNKNMFYLKIFGLWPGKTISTFYKFYSAVYLFITIPIYILLLITSMLHTPRKVDLILQESLAYFTEFSMIPKVYMMLVNRSKIFALLSIIDSEIFQGEDDVSRKIVFRYVAAYKVYWRFMFIVSNMALWCQLLFPLFNHFVYGTSVLPVCNYYFLDDATKEHYYMYFYLYISIGVFGHMHYNFNIATFANGLILIAVAQVEVINYEFSSKITSIDETAEEDRDKVLIKNLNRSLKHYDLLLAYTSLLQDIISMPMFILFGVSSVGLCAIICNMFPSPSPKMITMLAPYLFVVTLQIFVPSYLGTLLSLKSQDLVNAAYFSKWIPTSESFKRSLKVFMQRAHTSILLTGCGLFPLTLDTFTSIMKSAYSVFALVRTIQDRE